MIVDSQDMLEMSGRLTVVGCRSDTSSTQLEFEASDAKWTLTIEGAFSLTRATRPEGQSTPERMTELIGESVLSLRAQKADGHLRLSFTSDWLLTVYPDIQYEAWEMYSTRGDRLVSVPGDGIARWSPS